VLLGPLQALSAAVVAVRTPAAVTLATPPAGVKAASRRESHSRHGDRHQPRFEEVMSDSEAEARRAPPPTPVPGTTVPPRTLPSLLQDGPPEEPLGPPARRHSLNMN
jgi:hypothetical protein